MSERTKHAIPKDAYNSDIVFCVDEFVREVEHREMLKDWWFHGYTLEGLGEKYHKSTTSVKDIIYETGDEILLRALQRSQKREGQG